MGCNKIALLLLSERFGKQLCRGLARFGVEGGTLELPCVGHGVAPAPGQWRVTSRLPLSGCAQLKGTYVPVK
jgi:hypothetical protein